MPAADTPGDLLLCPGGPALRRGALHEIVCPARDAEEAALPAAFAAWAAARAHAADAAGRPVLWALARPDLYPHGLAGFGLAPDSLLVAEGRNDREVLLAMDDGVRSGGLAAIVGELATLDLTASRRLQLGAAASATLALVLRRSRTPRQARAGPNAAWSRWEVEALPSAGPSPDEPFARRIGRPRWRLACLRVRNGGPAAYVVDVDDAAIPFTLSARLATDLRTAAPARRQAG